MGLLSARGLRQIAIGAGNEYLDKRQEMRDKIEEFRTRAADKKETLQKEYNAYYKEEKGNMQTFKNIATIVGENYTDQLNSFVMSGGDLNSLSQLDSNGIVDKLSTQKPVEGQVSYLDKVSGDIKLKNEEVNQSLQDQVGLYKGTSTLFTRGIEERGIKDIQSDVGTISAGEPIDTKFSAGKSIDITELRPNDRITAQKLLTDLYGDPNDPDGGYNIETIQPLLNKADIMIENGFDGTQQQAMEELIFKQQYDNYNGTNLDFLTPVSQNDPQILELEKVFVEANSETADLIILQDAVNKIKPLNKFKAEEYQIFINEIKAEREGKTNTDGTVTVEETPAKVEPRPPSFGGGAEGKAKREAWDLQYGNTHFNDGTLMSPAQQEAWKESQAKKGGGKSKKSIRRLID